MADETRCTLTVHLSTQEQNLVLDALVNSKLDTDRYLGTQPIGEPKPTDTCCPAHREDYEQRKNIEASLLGRKQNLQSLIDRLEAGQQADGDSLQLDPRLVELVYKDEAGQMHTQPVSEVPTSGTLCDPETGNDLDIVSLQLVDKHR